MKYIGLITIFILIIGFWAYNKKQEQPTFLYDYEIIYSGLYGREGERRFYVDTLHLPQVASVSIAQIKEDYEDSSFVGEYILLVQFVKGYDAPHYVNPMTMATYFVPVDVGADSLVSFRQLK